MYVRICMLYIYIHIKGVSNLMAHLKRWKIYMRK